jgi:hypothetical protein
VASGLDLLEAGALGVGSNAGTVVLNKATAGWGPLRPPIGPNKPTGGQVREYPDTRIGHTFDQELIGVVDEVGPTVEHLQD